jgi:hypothetical protein
VQALQDLRHRWIQRLPHRSPTPRRQCKE